VLAYVVTFATTVAICLNADLPLVERYTLNPVSLFELSVQDRSISLDDAAVAIRFVGAAGAGVGVACACAVGESAKEASANGMRSKPRRTGKRFIESLANGVILFDLNNFIAVVLPLSG
jgi:hypothetical protein